MTDSIKTGRLFGKAAVITGGTTGIGFETARRYIAEGARVLITGRSQDRVDQAVNELGDGALGLVADVGRLSDLDALAADARARLGRVDILFANAGLGVFAPIDQVDEAAYDSQFDVNVKGVFFTVQKLLPLVPDGSSVVLTRLLAPSGQKLRGALIPLLERLRGGELPRVWTC